MDELQLEERTVVCVTEGCENHRVELTLMCADAVVCGVCGNGITTSAG